MAECSRLTFSIPFSRTKSLTQTAGASALAVPALEACQLVLEVRPTRASVKSPRIPLSWNFFRPHSRAVLFGSIMKFLAFFTAFWNHSEYYSQ
jgi:hypothetical protein